MIDNQHPARNLNEYIVNLSLDLEVQNRRHTSRNLKSSLANLERFRDNKIIDFKDINENFIKEYETFLLNRRISLDTASFYMRTFKMILNHAFEDGLINFKAAWFESINTNAYKRPERTMQKALDLTVMKKISDLDLTDKPKLNFARDIFMFSFFMQGLELSDILNLKKENIVNGCLVFNRRKVGLLKSIPLTGKALAIIAKHFDERNDALFSLKVGVNVPSLKYASGSIVRYLLQVGELVNCPKLTFSQARATWLSLTSQVNLIDRLLEYN